MTLLSPRALRLATRGLAGAALALAAAASPAYAHSAFLGSDPEPGARIEQSPARVSLRFTEPLERKLSKAKLVAVDSGDPLPAEVSAPSSKELALVPSAPLRRGAYRVEWHTVSTLDGHALEGSFSFGLGAAAAGGDHTLEESPLARGGWFRVLSRAVMYAALLLFVGALLLDALLRSGARVSGWLVPTGAAGEAALLRRARAVTLDSGLIAAAAAAVAAVADAADAAGSLSGSGLSDYLLGGVPGLGRVATVLLVTIAALLAARGWRVGAVPAAAALLAVAASGHAASAEPRALAIMTDWVHLLAAAAWLGGIALIVIVWWASIWNGGRTVRLYAAREVLPAFGRVALPAFILVASTGAVSALVQLGQLQALWQTAYGRVLLAKVALVALIAAASYTHALRLRPRLVAANPHPEERIERRHWRLLRSEPLLGAAVVVAVAFLVAFPLPPRQLGEADEAAAAERPCDPCPLPRPAADELSVAEHAGSRLVAAWLRRRGDRLSGTVRVLGIRDEPVHARATVVGARQSSCGPGCWRFSLRASGEPLEVAMRERGRRYVARLPTRWSQGSSRRARRMLARTQRTMSRLRSMRELETVTSAPGAFARTVYRLQAPNRFSYVTNGGVESTVVGGRQWFREPGSDWRGQRYGGGGPPFRTRSWFRWTPYAQEVRLLRDDGRRMELALMDPGTPVWLRLTVDLGTMRTVRERMIATAHFMTRRYLDFNRPVVVRPPDPQ
jgi:copper transport protein